MSTPWAKSLLSLMAILARELDGRHVVHGGHGTYLIAMNPRDKNDELYDLLDKKILKPPNICNKVQNKPSNCTIDEFNNGGTAFQALTNIAGMDVGGGGQLCHLAQSQDESLVQFYPETFALSFFSNKMMPSPWTVLGARRYINDFSGQVKPREWNMNCGRVLSENWLNNDIGQVTTVVEVAPAEGQEKIKMEVYASGWTAVASGCSACGHGGSCSHSDLKNNKCDYQRRHMNSDLQRWYQAYSRNMYNTVVQDAFGKIVKSIATGPWGSGVWFGNSQMYFLTLWIATSLLDSEPQLDYYVYDQFCENPGNQCFVLAKDQCLDCLSTTSNKGLNTANCGTAGLHDMINQYKGRKVRDLFNPLQNLPAPSAGPVFDNIKAFTQLAA